MPLGQKNLHYLCAGTRRAANRHGTIVLPKFYQGVSFPFSLRPRPERMGRAIERTQSGDGFVGAAMTCGN